MNGPTTNQTDPDPSHLADFQERCLSMLEAARKLPIESHFTTFYDADHQVWWLYLPESHERDQIEAVAVCRQPIVRSTWRLRWRDRLQRWWQAWASAVAPSYFASLRPHLHSIDPDSLRTARPPMKTAQRTRLPGRDSRDH